MQGIYKLLLTPLYHLDSLIIVINDNNMALHDHGKVA